MASENATSTLNISLPSVLKVYVERQVAERSYTSASEFIRMLIRHHQEIAGRVDHLEDLLLEGLDSGPGVDASPEYWSRKRASHSAPPASARKRRAR